MRYVNGTRLDDRIIRTDWDAGFKEGRQYGRGKSGGQVCIVSLYFYGNFIATIPDFFPVILTWIIYALLSLYLIIVIK